MSEAYYALQDLVKYQARHEERHAGLLDSNGTWITEKNNVSKSIPPLLVLMQCLQGTSTWSLVTEEYAFSKYTFIDMVKLRLSLRINSVMSVSLISCKVLQDAYEGSIRLVIV